MSSMHTNSGIWTEVAALAVEVSLVNVALLLGSVCLNHCQNHIVMSKLQLYLLIFIGIQQQTFSFP